MLSGQATPGSLVTIVDGDVVIGVVTADASGNWQFTPTLAKGNHTHHGGRRQQLRRYEPPVGGDQRQHLSDRSGGRNAPRKLDHDATRGRCRSRPRTRSAAPSKPCQAHRSFSKGRVEGLRGSRGRGAGVGARRRLSIESLEVRWLLNGSMPAAMVAFAPNETIDQAWDLGTLEPAASTLGLGRHRPGRGRGRHLVSFPAPGRRPGRPVGEHARRGNAPFAAC